MDLTRQLGKKNPNCFWKVIIHSCAKPPTSHCIRFVLLCCRSTSFTRQTAAWMLYEAPLPTSLGRPLKGCESDEHHYISRIPIFLGTEIESLRGLCRIPLEKSMNRGISVKKTLQKCFKTYPCNIMCTPSSPRGPF
jgi:hypothetical protein